jgi:uncharacterized Zn finger protein (UPF0148 family)
LGERRGKMVEIECLLCGKPLNLPRYINPEDYDGEVVCQECESLLYIKLVKSELKKYSIRQKGFRKLSGEEAASLFQNLARERKKREVEEGRSHS